MKKFLLTLVVVLAAISAFAENKVAYGILTLDETEYRKVNSLVSFPLEGNFTTYNQIVQFGKTDVFAGAYANDAYYAETIKTNEIGAEVPDSLLRVDVKTGKYTRVGVLSGFSSKINDMSYDYATSTMWAIAVNSDNNASELYTIDLNTAVATKKFSLPKRYFTLACTYQGDLFAISFDGYLCKINKTTGEVTEVAQLNETPNYMQTMEFDHTTGTLYWAAQTSTVQGPVQLDESFMATIDTLTAQVTRLGAIGNEGQIVGLYIPFSASAANTPAAATDLKVVAGENGQPQATLEWVNPSKLFGGEPLTEITKISIYRNDKLVSTIAGNPGEKSSFLDKIEDNFVGGNVIYRVVVSNANGNGAPAEISAFVGVDTPAEAQNIKLKKEGIDQVTLTWDAPVASTNGGWFNPAEVSYRVMRNDSIVVTENTKELTITDKVTGKPRACSYTIIANNMAGQGGQVTSETMVLGPKNALPYTCDFSNDEDASQWVAIDADGDGNSWKLQVNAANKRRSWAYKPVSAGAGEDYAASHIFAFEAGKNYEVTAGIYIYGICDFEFVLLKDGKDPISIQKFDQYSTNWTSADITFSFTPTTSNDYQLAIKSLSDPNANFLFMHSMAVKELAGQNMIATAIDGDATPALEAASRYLVQVNNKGSKAVSDFKIELKDVATDKVLTALTSPAAIQPGEFKEYALDWTPADKSVTAVKATITCDEDATPEDNSTDAFKVNVQDAGNSSTFKVGTLSEGTTQFAPFALYDSNSGVLNIYKPEELGFSQKYIKQISYVGTSFMGKSFPVKVYMANTTHENAAEGWIPLNEMTLVYEGEATLKMTGATPKDCVLDIPLTTEFEYTGGNLAVFTDLNWDYNSLSGVFFKAYDRSENEGCGYWYGWGKFDTSKEMTVAKYNSAIAFTVNDKKTTAIESVETDNNVLYHTDNGMLYVNGDVKEISICDISGRKVLQTAKMPVNISSLHGTHLLTVHYMNGTQKAMLVIL